MYQILNINILNFQCLEVLFPIIILEATVIKVMCTKIEVV